MHLRWSLTWGRSPSVASQIGRRRVLHFLAFESVDRGPEPGAQRLLALLLCPGAVRGRDSLSGRGQWDMNTWNLFRLRLPWDELHKEAFAAGFALLLCPGAVRGRDSLSGRGQWDMNTWNLFRLRLPWDELHKEAFAAGFAVLVLGAKVHASGRVLENKPWPPGFAR